MKFTINTILYLLCASVVTGNVSNAVDSFGPAKVEVDQVTQQEVVPSQTVGQQETGYIHVCGTPGVDHMIKTREDGHMFMSFDTQKNNGEQRRKEMEFVRKFQKK